jgi:hypothetical protein
MEPRARAKPSRALEGEDLKTSHWEDARHWMSIYADLLEFKWGILDRVKRDLAGLQPLARKAAAVDVQIIEDQMQGYQATGPLVQADLGPPWITAGPPRPHDPASGPGSGAHVARVPRWLVSDARQVPCQADRVRSNRYDEAHRDFADGPFSRRY